MNLILKTSTYFLFFLCIISSIFRSTIYSISFFIEIVYIFISLFIILNMRLNKYLFYTSCLILFILIISYYKFGLTSYLIMSKNLITCIFSIIIFSKFKISLRILTNLCGVMLLYYLIEFTTGYGFKSIFVMSNEYWNQTSRLTGLFSNYHYSAFIYCLLMFLFFFKKTYILFVLYPFLILSGVYTSIIAFTAAIPLIILKRLSIYKINTFITFFIIGAFPLILFYGESIIENVFHFPKKNSLVALLQSLINIDFVIFFNFLPSDFHFFLENRNVEQSLFLRFFSDVGYFSHLYQYGIIFFLILIIYFFKFPLFFLYVCLSLFHNCYFFDPLAIAIVSSVSSNLNSFQINHA